MLSMLPLITTSQRPSAHFVLPSPLPLPILQHIVTQLQAPFITPILQVKKVSLREVRLPVQSWWQSRHTPAQRTWVSLAPTAPRSTRFSHLQVWFQNRRAKFRRNERAMLANRSASLLKSYSQEAAIEQPVAPRPTALSPDYLSWTASSPYR